MMCKDSQAHARYFYGGCDKLSVLRFCDMVILFPPVILLTKFLLHLGLMVYTQTEGILKQGAVV